MEYGRKGRVRGVYSWYLRSKQLLRLLNIGDSSQGKTQHKCKYNGTLLLVKYLTIKTAEIGPACGTGKAKTKQEVTFVIVWIHGYL